MILLSDPSTLLIQSRPERGSPQALRTEPQRAFPGARRGAIARQTAPAPQIIVFLVSLLKQL